MEHAKKTIKDLEARLSKLDTEASKIKTAINCLCEVIGEKPRYADSGSQSLPQKIETRADEYFGRPLARAVTEFLQKRKALGRGAAKLDEIHEELKTGGCDQVKGKDDSIRRRNLAISLSKNQKFFKLPNGTWGLSEWYPNAKTTREPSENAKAISVTSESTSGEKTTEQQEEPKA